MSTVSQQASYRLGDLKSTLEPGPALPVAPPKCQATILKPKRSVYLSANGILPESSGQIPLSVQGFEGAGGEL